MAEEEDEESAFPSEKEIREAFPKLGALKAKQLFDALKGAFEEDAPEDAVDDAMEEVNKILDGHGVEAVNGEGVHIDKYWRDTILLYVNLGDTYDTTVCYDTEEETFFIGSWGDFLEKWESEEEDEEEEEEEEEDDDEDEEDSEEKGEEEEEEVEENGE